MPGLPAISSLPSVVAPLLSSIPVPAVSGILADPVGSIPSIASSLLPGLGNAVGGVVNSVISGPVATPNPATPQVSPPAPADAIIVASGTVLDNVHTWTFYTNSVVQVDQTFLSPFSGVLWSVLPSGIAVILYTDGLHVGSNIVPYPAAFLFLVKQYKLPLLPLPGSSSVYGLPDSDST